MPARITVYCHKTLADVTADKLLAGVKQADLLTIAEGYGVPDEIAEQSCRQLRVENTGDGEFNTFLLMYGPDSIHQCRIDRRTDSDSIQAVFEEELDDLESKTHPLLSRIRRHFNEVKEIVFVTHGVNRGMEMAPVVASEIARWIAEVGSGIIQGADRTWWELGQWKEYKELAP